MTSQIFDKFNLEHKAFIKSGGYTSFNVSTSTNTKAYVMTRVFLENHNQKLNPENEQHQKLFCLSKSVVAGTPVDNFPFSDRVTAMEIRTIENDFKRNNNKLVEKSLDGVCSIVPVGGYYLKEGGGYFLIQPTELITYDDVKKSSEITDDNIHGILGLDLEKGVGDKVIVDWVRTKINELNHDIKQINDEIKKDDFLKKEIAEINFNLKVFVEQKGANAQPSEAPPQTQSTKPESAKMEQTPEINRKIQYCEMAAELAHSITKGIVGVKRASLSYSQAENRRTALKEQFQRLTEDLNLNLEHLQGASSYQHVYPVVLQQIFQRAVEDKAKIVDVYSKEFCGQAKALQQNIEYYLKNRDVLDNKRISLAALNQQIVDYFDAQLERKNRKSYFWEITGSLLNASASAAMAIPHPIAKVSAAVLGALSCMAYIPVINNEKNVNQKFKIYQEKLRQQTDAYRLVELAQQQNSQSLAFLQNQAWQYVHTLMANKQNMNSSTYRNELSKSIDNCNKNIDEASNKNIMLQPGIDELNEKLQKLRDTEEGYKTERIDRQEKNPKKHFSRHLKWDQEKVTKEIKEKENELAPLTEKQEKNNKEITNNTDARNNAANELEIANYIAPLTNEHDTFLAKVRKESESNEKNNALNQQLAIQYADQKEHHERYFRLRMAVAQAASPIASEFDFWTGTNIPSDIFKIVSASDQFMNYKTNFTTFMKNASLVAKCGNSQNSPTSTDTEKSDKVILFSLFKNLAEFIDDIDNKIATYFPSNPGGNKEGTDNAESNSPGGNAPDISPSGSSTPVSNATGSTPGNTNDSTTKTEIESVGDRLAWEILTTNVINILGMMHSWMVIAHSIYSIINWRKNVPLAVTISKLLNNYQKKLDERLGELEGKIDGKHQELKDHINVLRKENHENKIEILMSIGELQQKVVDQGDYQTNNQFIALISQQRDNINSFTNNSQLSIQNVIDLFLTHLKSCCDTHLNGAHYHSKMHGSDFMNYVAKRPSCYSGFIHKQLFSNESDSDHFPNLFLFDFIISRMIEFCRNNANLDETQKSLLSESIHCALNQYLRIENLMTFPADLLQKVIQTQEELLFKIKNAYAFMQLFKEQSIKVQGEQFLKGLVVDSEKFHLDKPIGWKKFAVNQLMGISIERNYFDSCDVSDVHYSNRPEAISRLLTPYTLHDFSKTSIVVTKSSDCLAFQTVFSILQAESELWIKYTLDASLKNLEVKHLVKINHSTNSKSTLYRTSTTAKKTLMEFTAVLTAHEQTIKIGFHLDEKNYLEAKDIDQIAIDYTTKPCTEKEYNETLNSLIRSYFDFLKSCKNKTVVAIHNPFATIQSAVCILPNDDSSLLPLAFPMKLMESLEQNSLGHDLLFMEGTKLGTLIPISYRLKNSSNFSYQLTIQYNFFPLSSEEKPQFYCEVEVAEFDAKVVHSFSDPVITGEEISVKSLHLNEFLIQIFYCGFAKNQVLGIPGEGTHKLVKSKVVAPKEQASPGLYKLFTESPSIKQSFGMEKAKHPFRIHYNFSQYLKVHNEIAYKMREFDKSNLDRYRKQYQFLEACLHLQCRVKPRELREMLFSTTSLISPDSTRSIYLEFFQRELNGSLSHDIFPLEKFVFDNPSDLQEVMINHYYNLNEMKKWLNGDRSMAFKPNKRVSDWVPL